jgi:hypothetical protein
MSDNAWMQHEKRFRQRNSKMNYRQVLREARKTYGGNGIVGYSDSVVARDAGRVGGGPLSPMPLKSDVKGAVSGGMTKSMPVHKSMPKMTKSGGRRRNRQTRRSRR